MPNLKNILNSTDNGIVLYTAPCGTGKSTAILENAQNNQDKKTLVLVNRKNTKFSFNDKKQSNLKAQTFQTPLINTDEFDALIFDESHAFILESFNPYADEHFRMLIDASKRVPVVFTSATNYLMEELLKKRGIPYRQFISQERAIKINKSFLYNCEHKEFFQKAIDTAILTKDEYTVIAVDDVRTMVYIAEELHKQGISSVLCFSDAYEGTAFNNSSLSKEECLKAKQYLEEHGVPQNGEKVIITNRTAVEGVSFLIKAKNSFIATSEIDYIIQFAGRARKGTENLHLLKIDFDKETERLNKNYERVLKINLNRKFIQQMNERPELFAVAENRSQYQRCTAELMAMNEPYENINYHGEPFSINQLRVDSYVIRRARASLLEEKHPMEVLRDVSLSLGVAEENIQQFVRKNLHLENQFITSAGEFAHKRFAAKEMKRLIVELDAKDVHRNPIKTYGGINEHVLVNYEIIQKRSNRGIYYLIQKKV